MNNILFIDIETVSEKKYFAELDEEWKELWIKKSHQLHVDTENPEESYHNKAAIYAEFGKVICISIGTLSKNTEQKKSFAIKSFFGKEENIVLQNFSKALSDYQERYGEIIFSGHNIAEFDIPFLSRRFLTNKIAIPKSLNFQNKKPWEVTMHDTLKMWKFGDYKNYTPLNLLTKLMKIPSPKYDIDGSKVGDVYYHENDLPRIIHYCEEDVIAVAKLFYTMQYLKDVDDWDILRQTDI